MDIVFPSAVELGIGFLAFVGVVVLVASLVSWDLRRIGVSYWWAIGALALAACPLGVLAWVVVRLVERRKTSTPTSV